MKCPNCDTNNGRTNKYCRTCGTRLEVLASREQDTVPVKDDVALGEELFAVHELVESGDLDTALERSEALSEENPDSASAHAIVALIYERKSEEAFGGGDPARGREYLKLTIDRYETIVDLNPDSAADRGKLASLRMRYSGQASLAPEPGPRVKVIDALSSVPKPALISGAAFVVLATMVIAITSPLRGGREPVRPSGPRLPARSIVTVTQAPDQARNLKVYTFPQATTAVATPTAPVPTAAPAVEAPKTPAPSSPPPFVEVRPMKVPKIDQELTLVPAPKDTPKKPATEPVKPGKSADNKQPSGTQPSASPSAASGNSVFAQAIRLHDQGKITEAIGAANQAIVLWNADIEAGKNVDVARRGVANASKSISVWQSSVAQ